MIEQTATVLHYDDNTVWLRVERQSTCSACALKQGCGTGLLAKHIGQRFSEISIAKTVDVTIGQQVQLVIAEQALLHSAVLMYLVPLLLLFVFSAMAQIMNVTEMVEIFAGLTGLLLGFYWLSIRSKQDKNGVKLTIINK